MDAKAPVFGSNEFSEALPVRDGHYDRARCNVRMEKDVAQSAEDSCGEPSPVKYCRKCEFVCLVGKK